MRWKICVYAISKNEVSHVERWVASMQEADWVVVMDTGSTDGTVEKLRALGVHVEVQPVEPWRFDVARNLSMRLIPKEADIAVCTDLDEEFAPGWREKLDNAWQAGAKKARYRYTWNFNPDGTEGTVFLYDKIHANTADFTWEHPVHEVVTYIGNEPYSSVLLEGVQLNHRADMGKSRSQYLPLLEMAVREDPGSERNWHYLGREYMHYQEWDKCIQTLEHYLAMPAATWVPERCAAMRYIGRSYVAKEENDQALKWFWKALAEAPHLREPYMEMVRFFFKLSDWHGVVFMVEKMVRIVQRTAEYICEGEAWGSMPFDLASIAFFRLGNLSMAIQMSKGALVLSPTDERIQNNLKLFEDTLIKLSEVKKHLTPE
jgi:glycosyltransferase involved in cell wall biosynthesis